MGGAWTIDPVFPSRAICDLVRFAAFLCERREQKAERLITVLIGGAEIVLCGIVLEGSAASYAMIGLMILFCAFEIVSQVRDSRSL